jgi:O-antigen/teichoic acid export membrane protein
MLLSLSVAGAVSLLVSITIARMVGVEDFGVYSILISVQNVVAIFAIFGIGTALAKFIAEFKVRSTEQAYRFAKTGLFLVLVLGLVASLVYAALSGLIGNTLYKEPLVVSLIPFSALVVFTFAMLAALIGIVQGCQKIKLLAAIQVSGPVLNLVFIVLFLSLLDLKGIFVGYFVAQILLVSVVAVILNRGDFKFLRVPLQLRSSGVVAKTFGFALPAFLGSIIVLPVYWVGNTLLTLDSGFDAMGYFAVAYVIFQSLVMMPTAVVIPMIPKVSELSVMDNDRIESLVGKTVRTLSIVLFPLMFGLALFAHYVVELLYGSKYSSSTEVVYLMVSATYFYALSALVGALIAGKGRMWLGLAINLCWAAIFLLIALFAVPSEGVNGLGLAFAVSYGIFLVASFVVSKESLGVDLKSTYMSAASSAVFFIVGFVLLSEVGPSEILLKLALFAVAVVYFFVIGRDAFAYVFGKARGMLRAGSR